MRSRQWRLRLAFAALLVSSLFAGCAIGRPGPFKLPSTSRPSPPPRAAKRIKPQLEPSAPFAITAGHDDAMWFTEFRADRIGRIDPLGDVTGFKLEAGGFAERLVAGPGGAIWYTDPAGNRIGRLARDGSVETVPIPTPNSGPAGITVGSDGNLWFTEHAANMVGRITPLGSLSEFALPDAGGPAGITAAPDGKLYIAENISNRIIRMSTKGRIKIFEVPHPNRIPNAIAATSDGDVWFTELGDGGLGRLLPDGHIEEYKLPVHGVPFGIAAAPNGDVWLTMAKANALCRINPDGEVTTFHLPEGTNPSFIAAGPYGNLWFTQPDGRIGRFNPLGFLKEFKIAVPAMPSKADGSSSD
jgi:virginiamycin B lyase